MHRTKLTLLAAGSTLAFISMTALASASGGPPLPKHTLFQAINPHNIDEVRNRIDGSANDRNLIPTGTVLVYRTGEGNTGKMQILRYGYNLRIKWITYRPSGKILSRGDNAKIRGTFSFDLDRGRELNDFRGRTADLWWEIVGGTQRYLKFEGGAFFTVVT